MDQLGAMFSRDHRPVTLEEWTYPPTPAPRPDMQLAKKRKLLNAMEWGLKFGIAAPKIDELRREIEELENGRAGHSCQNRN